MLFTARALRGTIVDNRRAKIRRAYSESTGQLGELVVVRGAGKVKRGTKYPILQEGSIGSGSSADIRIRDASVHKRHAHYRMTRGGMRLKAIGDAPLEFIDGKTGSYLLATDNDTLIIGPLHLLVVLFDGQSTQVHARSSAPYVSTHYDEYDFEDDPDYDTDHLDDPFMLNQEAPWQKNSKRKNTTRR